MMISIVRDDPEVVRLVAGARAGDQGAWDAIVDRYAPLIWATGRRYGLSEADLDDVGASVWLRLVEAIETIREPAALPGWLMTTVQRECLRLIRKAGRVVLVGDDRFAADPAHDDTDAWLLRHERHIAVRAAFSELPPRCRHLLSLLFADPPMPYAEIEAATGTPAGAIGPTRARCLDRLRRSPRLAFLGEGAPTS
jgi:RNA polymerase sigma factor (sigma-70 family)